MEKLKFSELNVSKEILKAVEELGFEEATPIQSTAIPVILEGRDVIGQAQTGTGKTAAFGIPVLEKVDATNKSLQAIILCPTRELAVQVSEELKKLSKYKRGINVLPIYGGQSIERQIHSLKKGVQIVIGTPGRVIDHLDRGTLRLDYVRMFVLDEADEMLNMGFIEDIEYILEKTPKDKQTVLFSATIPEPILKLTKKYLKNPEYIKVVHKELTVPTIEQGYFEVKEGDKIEVLSRLLDIYNPNLALVFCNTKKKVDDVVNSLQARGYLADALHGDMKQSQRDRVMSKFRNGQIDILVATDVAARGIDVENVEMVFNYDVPQDEEYYVHRIGRTGRAGKEGRAYSFVSGKEIYKLRDIQRYAKTKIKLLKVPTLHDVEESRANIIIDRIKTIINENNLERYSDIIERIVGDDYTSLDVAAALLKMVINLDKKADDIDKEFQNTGAEPGMVRLFINVGRNQRISPRDIVGAIADKVKIPGDLIGSIDIYDKFSFVEVPSEYAKEVLEIMKDNTIKGKKVNVEVAKGK